LSVVRRKLLFGLGNCVMPLVPGAWGLYTGFMAFPYEEIRLILTSEFLSPESKTNDFESNFWNSLFLK